MTEWKSNALWDALYGYVQHTVRSSLRPMVTQTKNTYRTHYQPFLSTNIRTNMPVSPETCVQIRKSRRKFAQKIRTCQDYENWLYFHYEIIYFCRVNPYFIDIIGWCSVNFMNFNQNSSYIFMKFYEESIGPQWVRRR